MKTLAEAGLATWLLRMPPAVLAHAPPCLGHPSGIGKRPSPDLESGPAWHAAIASVRGP